MTAWQRCGSGDRIGLVLSSDGAHISVDVTVSSSSGMARRVVMLHERKLAWRATVPADRSGGVSARRVVQDLAGADDIQVRASADRGPTCVVEARLPA